MGPFRDCPVCKSAERLGSSATAEEGMVAVLAVATLAIRDGRLDEVAAGVCTKHAKAVMTEALGQAVATQAWGRDDA